MNVDGADGGSATAAPMSLTFSHTTWDTVNSVRLTVVGQGNHQPPAGLPNALQGKHAALLPRALSFARKLRRHPWRRSGRSQDVGEDAAGLGEADQVGAWCLIGPSTPARGLSLSNGDAPRSTRLSSRLSPPLSNSSKLPVANTETRRSSWLTSTAFWSRSAVRSQPTQPPQHIDARYRMAFLGPHSEKGCPVVDLPQSV